MALPVRNGLLSLQICEKMLRSTVIRSISTSLIANDVHRCKILVVGGGTGGCSVAAKAALKYGEGNVIVLEPSENHFYQPMFTLIGGGMKTLQNSLRPTKTVLPSLATWIQDSVSQFEPASNTVHTSAGARIEYEQMVVAIGLSLHYDRIPGLVEALSIDNGNVCSNYSPKYVDRTFQCMKRFTGGKAIFTFPSSPVKCPGAPQKAVYIAEDYFRKTGKKKNAEIVYNTALPVLFGVKHYADALWKVVAKRDIAVNLNTNLVAVDGQKSVATFEKLNAPGEKFTTEFAMLHVTPPMATPRVLSDCKDLATATGFLDVNKDTLQHNRFENIFGIGDCSSSPNSKTAASAAAQCPVVFGNLIDVREGRKPSHTYDGYASCPLVTGYKSCILAEFDYNLQPLETFPFPQNVERYSMFALKKHFMAPLYWHLMLNGFWNGPALMRKCLSILKRS